MKRHKISLQVIPGQRGLVGVVCSCEPNIVLRSRETIELREIVLLAFDHNEKVGR